ncbi:hypothetical protein M0R89_14585 [Halorussus limi]|uniref:Uncharacterized protein n=1 Tax=Halorussus limi TaxID=2938695 RepID=A0A8U0HS12_9EURY|nr:hypothetical protein [Halorussus limi]UPV73760.1 hypothetical protein M0R89_14585 [Halorussus limi]
MSLRTAAKRAPILLAGVVLFGAWVALNLFRVFDAIPSLWTGGTGVGQTLLGGLVGLLVMLTVVVLLVGLYSAISESSPAPESFPPTDSGLGSNR